jgi:sRNA-binding regulator protein Hfq
MAKDTTTMSNKATKQPTNTLKTEDGDFMRQLAKALRKSAPDAAGRLEHLAHQYDQMIERSHRIGAQYEADFYRGAREHLVRLANGDTVAGRVTHFAGLALIVEGEGGPTLVQKSQVSTVTPLKP